MCSFKSLLMMKKPSLIKTLFCTLSIVYLVDGGCTKYDNDDTNTYTVKCKCDNINLDLEVGHAYVAIFVNAIGIEITNCRNVTLRPNLFPRAYNLSSISFSKIENLHIDAALSLPSSVAVFKLSDIGFLNHFPVPGPDSLVLHSLKALALFSFENVTVLSPSYGSTSSFIDLPITEVNFNSVKFIGTLPKGALEFNCTSMTNFNAFKCHFGNMNESSFLVNSKENFNISGCSFGMVRSGAVRVFGQSVSIDGNSFHYLNGSNTLSVTGTEYISVSDNKFEKLGGPYALALAAKEETRTFIKNNQLPCGCYANNFILTLSERVNTSDCKSQVSFACALLEKQDCLFPNGKKDKIEISTPDIPDCPKPGVATALVNHSMRFQLYLILLCFIYYFV